MFGWFKKRSKEVKDYGAEVANYKEIKSSFSHIKEMANKTLNPRAQAQGRIESFEEAVERLNVKKEDLEQNYKNYSINFYIVFGFTILCMIIALYFLFFNDRLLTFISTISITALCLSLSIRFSFWAYQIKIQKLCSLSEWFHGYDWFPTFDINIPTLKEKKMKENLLKENKKINNKLLNNKS